MESNHLYLECKKCEDFHDYQLNNFQLQALPANWSSIDEKVVQLDEIPIVGENYIVSLRSPLKLDTEKPFWCIYLPLFSLSEGMETENEILQHRFCKCKATKLVSKNEFKAKLEVEVSEVSSFSDGYRYSTPSLKWTSLLNDKTVIEKYGNIMHFKT